MKIELEDALIDGIWDAHRACFEANAVWDTIPGARRRYDEAEARRRRMIATLCDGDEELTSWLDDHIFDLIDEGPAYLGRMFRQERALAAQSRVEDALCVLADYRAARKAV